MTSSAALTERSRGFLPSPVRDVFDIAMQPGMISLAGGNPDLQLEPMDWLAEATARSIRDDGCTVLQYGAGAGLDALREAIPRVMAAEGVSADAASVQVTAGSQMALDLVVKLLFNPGDTILTEGPTYVGALGVFGGAGLRIEHVAMDDDGMRVDDLAETLDRLARDGRRPRALYTIPNFQNPAGVSLAEDRRADVVRLCRDAGVVIIEDNPYGLLSFDGHYRTALASLDPDNVVYLGSFSKILAPGLRVGWASSPSWMRRPLQLASEATTICASVLNQQIAATFVTEQDFGAIIGRAVARYGERCSALEAALDASMPDGTIWTRPTGGFFTWVTLPDGWNAAEVLDLAIDDHVVFVPGSAFTADDRGANQFRLAYSLETPDRLSEGGRRLGHALTRYAQTRTAVHA